MSFANADISNLSNWQVIAIVAIVLVAAVVIIVLYEKRRSARLRSRFGATEYERAIAAGGSRRRAEEQLNEREKRVKSFHLRELSSADRSRFETQWMAVQQNFVDGPIGAVAEADQLLGEVMAARGYPVADFEQRAADISVDHPQVTENYRAAHEIAIRQVNGQATTEDLRRAMIHYRALFDDLVGAPRSVESKPETVVRTDYHSNPSLKAR
ncbi:MAG TPA: hypothetical protein VMU48_15850 [Terracidiphilus sp.]|nr:hypothetical protein [Terracidiphilus sp.]